MTSHVQSGVRARDLFGHPPGLTALFASEVWERFAYYGNAALIVLYMVKYLLDPSRIESVIGLVAVKGALEFLFGRLRRSRSLRTFSDSTPALRISRRSSAVFWPTACSANA
jgi:hypothetical protein